MLIIHNLTFERHDQTLFSEIQNELQNGELLQVQGANGSGKSTLLRILAGLLEPDSGTILWQNQSIFKQLDQYQQQIQYVGHQNGIKPYLTIHENLKLNCALFANPSESIENVLKKINLYHIMNTQALYLSAGQLRRLSLAKLLLNTALLWILDEPTTALDTEGQVLLTHLLKKHLAKGGMAILATHQHLEITKNIKTIRLERENA